MISQGDSTMTFSYWLDGLTVLVLTAICRARKIIVIARKKLLTNTWSKLVTFSLYTDFKVSMQILEQVWLVC